MASYQFKEYNEETETFETFYERLEQFLILEEAGDEKKKAYLLTLMGSKTYGVLKNLCSPILPKNKTFDDLIDILKRHFSPKRSIVVERFIFFKRMQLKEESISDYLVEIKRLASSCNFGNFLEDSLRDKMVCGLYNAKIQNRILSEGDISLAKVIEIALSMEAAEKNTKLFHLEQGEDCVDKLRMERKVESNFQNGKCKHCGKQHKELCRFKEAICFKCNKKGHIASICWSSRRNLRQHQNQPGNIHQIGDQEEEDEYVQKIISVTIPEYKINFASSDPPYLMELKVEGNFIKFEMDTGSGLTLISEKDFKNSLQHLKLEKASIIVRTYDGTVVPILGKINVKVECQDITYKLRALVVKGEKRALMGREWINRLKLGCFAVKHMPVEITIEEILKENQALFVETTEPIKGFTFSVNMCDVNPIFHKARPVPFAIRPAVTEALDKMVAKGYLCEVASSKWATPVVVVPKKNKEIRICCDFKVTLNKYLDTAAYPLPTQQDLFSTLAKGKYFSKLDLRNAYLQLEVDPGTRPLLTINTHKGLFRFKRMPFGLANAPSYFQSVMDRVLSGIGGVICYIDDVLIATASIEEHLALLKTIFARLAKYNIKLKKEKCLFLQKEIEYLGHLVTGEGIRPLDHKVQAIQKAKTPTNISELRSFLGLVNFYGKFIPNLPELLKPLHELLHKKRPWVWTKECGEAIDKCKNSITSERVLVPYDTTLPLCLATDASQIGVGAVLSHIIEGQERPIMFASRTLSGAEQNYSQIEKEALAIIYGVTKFHQFIYGRKFILITDHKPLVTILGPKSGIPTLSTSRLQRWALILSAYTYDIKFRRTQDHGNADLLSRFPVGCEEIPRLNNVYALSFVEELPITAEEIAKETEKDEVLSLAKFYTQQGWPEKVADHLRPYFQRKLELTVDGECLVWGMRVVIPPSLRIKMLNCLHETHSGMNKMKAVARSHFWWPNLDTQIEFLVNKCRSCQQSQDGPNKGKWQPWKWSTRPWQRIHIDFANKENINLLIVVDSHSKWIEAIPMRETTTRKTIEQLRRLFSSYGLPEELVSDNGPQFTGSEMKGFLEGNGIKQTLIPAYHPQSNGLAERAVRTIKTALDKNKRKIGDTIQDTLSKVLLAYRSTPHVTTGKTPSELFIGRALRTRVSLIHPSLASRVRDQQARQMKYDRRTHLEEFQIDDLVWCKNFRGGDKWIPGKIVGKKGTRVYTILIHGQVKAYHRDQIRKRWRNGEEDESGDGERQPEHSRGAGPSAIISEVVRDRGYMESMSPGLTSQRSDQDSEVQSDTDDGKSLEPLPSLDPEALKEEGPVLRRNPPRVRRPPPGLHRIVNRSDVRFSLPDHPHARREVATSSPRRRSDIVALISREATPELTSKIDTRVGFIWLNVFELGKLFELHVTDEDKGKLFFYYLEGRALEWYADEIAGTNIKQWVTIKQIFITRFGSSTATPLIDAQRRYLRRDESVNDYFQSKIRLLKQTSLSKVEQIQMLTEGLPAQWKISLAPIHFEDIETWIAQQQADLRFVKNPQIKSGIVTIRIRGHSKAVVPDSLWAKCLHHFHDGFGHPGKNKTLKLISTYYWWPQMLRTIKEYVSSCKVCQLSKQSNQPTIGHDQIPDSDLQPFDLIGLDTIVLGNEAKNTRHKYLQVIIDHHSRYIWASPTASNNSAAILNILRQLLSSGVPIKRILTDNGSNFTSRSFKNFLSENKIAHSLATSYHPQTCGMVEKANHTLLTRLRAAILEKPKQKWSTLVPFIVKTYNQTPHEVTKFSPKFLLYGIDESPSFSDHPITLEEARGLTRENTRKAQIKRKNLHDDKHPDVEFSEGDQVLRTVAKHHPYMSKLSPRQQGPFFVKKKISSLVYDIQDTEGRVHGCCDLHFRRLTPGFHRRAKAKASLEDDDVPIAIRRQSRSSRLKKKNAKAIYNRREIHVFGRIQKETESVSEYLVEIKRLASMYGFDEFSKESLRDKLVCGLRNAKIQRRILSEGDVPLARVVEIALSMEAAEKNTRIFHVNEPADSVDKIRAEVGNRYNREQKRKCIHCGRLHKDLCRFREATCFRCGKRGHLATICRSRGEHTSERQVSRFLNQRKINQIEDQEEEESVQRMVFMRTYDYRVKYATNDPPYVIKMRVEDTLMTFEIDTGSCLTLISEKDFKRYLPDVQVKEAGIIVKTYDGTVVPILGEIDVKVDFRGTIAKLRAVVVRGERKALLRREWINVLKIGNYFVNQMPLEDTLAELLSEHQVVFGETTDPIKGFTFAVNIQDINPIFHMARPVPFAIRTAVNEVLERMVEKDYLYQVPSSKWATPVVVVPKKNKEFRICCDFKVTLNRFLDTAAYPLPTQQDLFSVLARGKYFSKLDLSNAYLQLEVNPSTQPLLTINTHKVGGRLVKPFGLRPLGPGIVIGSGQGSVRRRSRSVKGELPPRKCWCHMMPLPLSLATDASQIGVGAVLSHVIEGQEKPILFASRTLSGAKRDYSQIEREALAIIYGVTKFHQFIYGRQFTLITDHKPLVSILGPRAGIPTLSTPRLQRWGLTLAAYTYEIKFRRTQDHGNADLSRLPVESDETPVLNQTFILSYVEDLPVTAAEIGVETKKDEVLSVVKRYTQQGWPERVGEYLRPYFQRKLELTMDGECLLWGMRVIIPSSLRKNMLSCLHETHSGMGKMKAVARSHFWWPNLDNQIECMVNGCKNCQQTQTGPSKVNWRPWVWATRPWQRIHMDFAFKDGVNLLIVVDSHSKWVEAIPMREITARKTIEQLRRLFSAYGLPEEVVSDNGPQFTGVEMKSFFERNGVRQTLIPAYHPQSNGLAERAVQLIKMALEKNKRKFEDTIQDTLSRILLTYRCTPHETTGKTPSELFMGRSLRTRLTLIHQSLDNGVRERQARQMRYDRGRGQEEFDVDDKVWCKNFRGVGWITKRIVGRKGSRVYTFLINGQVKTYHQDQIRRRWTSGEEGDEAREKREEEDDPIWMAPEKNIPYAISSNERIKNPSAKCLHEFMDVCKEAIRNLETLELKRNQFVDVILVHFLQQKLSENLRLDWELSMDNTLPSYDKFIAFISRHARSMSCAVKECSKKEETTGSRFPKCQSYGMLIESSDTCILCKSKHHPLYMCNLFCKMPLKEKLNLVKSHKLCFNCLRKGHFSWNCRLNQRCKVCKGKHHTMIHYDKPSTEGASAQVENTTPKEHESAINLTNTQQANCNDSHVLLATARIKIKNGLGKLCTCRALLDSGSQVTMITKGCCERLGLVQKKSDRMIIGVGNTPVQHSSSTVSVTFCPLNNSEEFSVEAVVTGVLTSEIPNFRLKDPNWPTLKNLKLADPEFYIQAPIDMILGADIYTELMLNGSISLGEGLPMAINTRLGWVLLGKLMGTSESNTEVCNLSLQSEPELEFVLKRFWETESVPSPDLCTQDEDCERLFSNNHGRDSHGRYWVKLPFRQHRPLLGESREKALRRFLSLEGKLCKNVKLYDQYRGFMKEYEHLNHMERVPIAEVKRELCRCYYMPHHPVIREQSTTTKMRIVFDASAKSENNVSLNQFLHKGPKIQQDVFFILLRFRTYPVAITADIEKMYRQIRIHPEDADYQRILWRPSPEEPVVDYRLLTVTYGTTSAPFLAMRTLQQLAEDEGHNYPEASRVTLNDFYVDDLLTGAQTIAETKELIDQLKDLMKKGGFHLRKWNSNCQEIVSHVEEMNEEKKINLEKGAISKILGIVWDHVQDTFRVNITLPEEVVTKRDLLSNIARIFDPLGFLSPTTVALKIIMQELWRGGTGWDEHIPNDIKEKYVWACEKDRDVQLHGFCDASSVAYSAVCYLRTVSLDGQVHISMLAAKTRVAPCKSLTLPRLELCAPLLLSQLYRSVVDSLKIDIGRAYLWSDSQISLSWIKSDPNRWKTFIHNRVVKIQQLSDRNSWRHVSGKDNPADCASRGIMPAALSEHTLWWQGPTWLKDNNFVQNQDNCYGRECHEEEKVALACQSRVSVCPEVVTKYSTFIKTRRIIAWCLRFITNCRVSLKKREIGTLSKKELENAVIRIIGWIQKDEFGEEMQDLRNTGHASRKSRILQLNPFIDASGMLRVGGRIKFRAKTAVQIMGNLPADRVNPSRPFTKTGVDLAGFYELKPSLTRSKGTIKCYVILFVCFSVKAIHLEMVTSLSTSSFIAALRRFISRRGKPSKIYSDNGTNFRGTESFMKKQYKIMNSKETKDFLAEELIEWHFIPPSAPHFGGLWEANIKCLKGHLSKVIKSSLLNSEEFITLLCQVEACLNSRPLVELSPDPNDLRALTPGHFLIGSPLVEDPGLQNYERVDLRSRWNLVQSLRNSFWSRWTREYINSLQQRNKWRLSQDNLKPNQLVLIKEDNLPPLQWRLARILKVYPGSDQKVRVAQVRAATGVYLRPITKLAPFPSNLNQGSAAGG
ncbi:K02A2.6-like, partial [Cordylochernes scorpioides]